MKFRKKPVVIDAVLWTGQNIDEVFALCDLRVILGEGDTILIKTIDGTMQANKGDWIIKGTLGECYPCKPDVFASVYDPV